MNLSPALKQRYFDANGNPLSGGRLYTYAAGTSTPQVTYTDQSGLAPNANPVVLNANGEADLWLNPDLSYKFILKDSNDVTQWSVDNVIGVLSVDAMNTASIQNGAVTTPKIADDAVTAVKLKSSVSVDADRSVTTNHVRDSAVTRAKLDASTTAPNEISNLCPAAFVFLNALIVSLLTKTGNPSSTDPITIGFRNPADPTIGFFNSRTISSALSLPIPSGATLGHASGVNQHVYIWALDNAGTIELAVSGQQSFDTGVLQSTTAISASSTSGAVLYSAEARSNVPIRLIGRVRVNQAVAGVWASAPLEVSFLTEQKKQQRSSVRVDSGNGHGSTNTRIRRFANVRENIGSDISYVDSATLGASFTINADGLYSISYIDTSSSTQPNFGISKNSTELTTSIGSINAADRIWAISPNTSETDGSSCVIALRAGDVIRPHTDANPNSTGAANASFIITKVAD